jgi:hypothetical protein
MAEWEKQLRAYRLILHLPQHYSVTVTQGAQVVFDNVTVFL